MTTNKRLTEILFVSLLLATVIMPVVIAQNSNFSKKIKLFNDECTFGEIELPAPKFLSTIIISYELI